MSILIAILIFGIIVLVHEWGHFIVARKNGILVEEFAIGMGPKLFGVQKGDTLYSVRLLPIGGYCRMLGEDVGSEDNRAFSNKRVSQRIAVAVAGALMNFLLAFVLFFILSLVNGVTLPVVNKLSNGYPAQYQGMLPGDRILAIDGNRVHVYDEIGFILSDYHPEQPLDITIRRGKEIFHKTLTPLFKQDEQRYLIGFEPQKKAGLLNFSPEAGPKAGLFETISVGFFNMVYMIELTLTGLVRLVSRRLGVNEMSGIIGIVQVIGVTYEQVKTSIWDTIQTMAFMTAFISANLGVFNLLPLPALDGGRLVFLTIEGIRKKPVSPDKEGMIHLIGFVALMILAVFIAFNDIKRLL